MESVKFETNHDPRCSWWVDDICVCQQIAELEEKAEWLGRKEPDFEHHYGGSSSFTFYDTMTAPPPYGTYVTAADPWIPKRTAGIAEVDSRAEARADIYARADARRRERTEGGWR